MLDSKPSMIEKVAPSSKRGGDYYFRHIEGVGGTQWKNDFAEKKVVDLGAGGDDLSAYLNNVGVKPEGVLSLDLNYPRKFLGQEMVNPEHGFVLNADMVKLPLDDNSVDTIVSSEAAVRWLPRSKQPLAVLEAMRVVKPGGKVYLWEFRWDMSLDPHKLGEIISEVYPNAQFMFDKDTRSMMITKGQEVLPEQVVSIKGVDNFFRMAVKNNRVEEIAGTEIVLPYDKKHKQEMALLKIKYPFLRMDVDDLEKNIKVTALEVKLPFIGEKIADLSKMLETLNNPELIRLVTEVVGVGMKDSDTLPNLSRRAQYLLNTITSQYGYAMEEFNVSELAQVKVILATAIDSGNEIGNNSFFQRARARSIREVLFSDDNFHIQKGAKALNLVKNEFNPDLMTVDDKMKALMSAMYSPSWTRGHEVVLNKLQTTGDAKDNKIVRLMKSNIFSLPKRDKQEIASYFKELLKRNKSGDLGAREKLEIFRVLGNDHKIDIYDELFAQMHGNSVYDVARYWANGNTQGPVQALVRMLAPVDAEGKNKHRGLHNFAGEEITLDYYNDATPEEFAREVIKWVSRPNIMLKNRQVMAIINCPGCYGYADGFKGQRQVQEMGSEEAFYDPKRVDFALSAMRVTGLN